MKLTRKIALIGGMGMVLASSWVLAKQKSADNEIDRGRYLVAIGGCNDCHTPGYAQQGGKIAEAEWLTGDRVGWQGPWGTTYPTNLRLMFQQLSEQEWLARARQPMRPPMPSPSLQAMSERDLRAIYRYLRHLGPKGAPAPAYAPPGASVSTPYFDFTPKNPPPDPDAAR
jgi:mono/diheme cytochrome c family protein